MVTQNISRQEEAGSTENEKLRILGDPSPYSLLDAEAYLLG